MNPSQHKRPIWRGVLLAAFAPWLCMLIWMAFAKSESDTIATFVAVAGLFFVFAFPVALAAVLALGLPYIFWLRSRNALNVYTVCAGSIVIGAIAFGLFGWAMTWNHRAPELEQYLYGAGFGLVSGIAFCLGTGPNNSFKPKPLRGSA